MDDHVNEIITISGPSDVNYHILLQRLDDELVLTNGWEAVVSREGIEQLDVGRFNRIGKTMFKLSLFDRTGEEKTPFEKNSFLRLFRGGPPTGLSIPERIKARFVPHIGQLVTVAGPSGGVYPVRLAMYGDEAFLADGIVALTRYECVEPMDVGHFALTDQLSLQLILYSRAGIQNPHADTDTPYPVFVEADPWEHVQFEARPTNILNPFVKHRVHCSWINSSQTFRLYVVSLTREQIQHHMYFSDAFSFLLPEVPAPLVMRLSGCSVLTNATIIKVVGQSRITDGSATTGFA
ncbi:hypothetical protein EJB05_09235, partial [Eragrostis curvula]